MTVILNKIDPVIVNTIHQQAAEGVVHKSQQSKIWKDKGESKDNQPSYKKMKEKIEKFNSMLEAMDFDVAFSVEGEYITAAGKDGKTISTYTKDAAVELFSKMEDMVGVFIDTKR